MSAAAETVMLDLLNEAGITVAPDDIEELTAPMVVPCRICAEPVEVPPFTEDRRGDLMRTTYCLDHEG